MNEAIFFGNPPLPLSRQASSVVTLYWALLFAFMALGVAANIFCNTLLAPDGHTLVTWITLNHGE